MTKSANSTAEQVTQEIENEVTAAMKNPMFGRFLAPLRLVVVWMRTVNREIREIREFMNRRDDGITMEHQGE